MRGKALLSQGQKRLLIRSQIHLASPQHLSKGKGGIVLVILRLNVQRDFPGALDVKGHHRHAGLQDEIERCAGHRTPWRIHHRGQGWQIDHHAPLLHLGCHSLPVHAHFSTGGDRESAHILIFQMGSELWRQRRAMDHQVDKLPPRQNLLQPHQVLITELAGHDQKSTPLRQMLVTEQFEILERCGLFLEHDKWRGGDGNRGV